MVELLLTASQGHGYGCTPPGFGGCFSRLLPKDFNHFLHYQYSSIDLTNPNSMELCLQSKVDSCTRSRLLESNKLIMMDSNPLCPAPANIQGTQLEMLLFGIQVAKQCIKQDNIMKLLAASGSMVKERSLHHLLYDFETHQPLTHLPLQRSAWSFTNAESELKSLGYPTRELYFNEHLMELKETSNLMGSIFHPDAELIYNHAQLSAISELQLPKNTMNKPSNLAMVVPYFDNRRSARSKTDTSNIKAAKIKNDNRQERIQEKKSINARISKGSLIYSNSNLHACESLLSIIFDPKHKPDKNAILSLKKSGPQFLTQVSGSIAGTGVAVVLSVIYGAICKGMLPVSSTKLWSVGFGIGLVWFSWGVNKLRDTLISICKSGVDKEKTMMDKNLKDICFRATVVMIIAFLSTGLI